MMEIVIKGEDKRDSKVYAGQVRYNEKGMFVLITYNGNCFDAIVLYDKDSSIRPFDWNSKNQTSDAIKEVYPYIAKAKIEINR